MKQKMDLANKIIAEQSKNKTAMIGVIIMNVVLALAYLIELVKGARAAGSYAIVAALCIVPSVLAIIVYARKKEITNVHG